LRRLRIDYRQQGLEARFTIEVAIFPENRACQHSQRIELLVLTKGGLP
jgi:hypothetical protein